MAYCSAGDLSQFIKERGKIIGLSTESLELYPHPKSGGLNETVVRCFLGQLGKFFHTGVEVWKEVDARTLVDALRLFREKGIIHRDIKPQVFIISFCY